MIEKVAVGQVVRCVGTRGELKIRPLTYDVGRFSGFSAVWVGPNESEAVEYVVESARVQARHPVLKLRGVESRSQAEGLRHSFLFIKPENVSQPPRGSYFVHDIVGMHVTTEFGKDVGVVQEVWPMPAHDVWVVRQGPREILIPAVKEIVKEVDIEKKRVMIHVIEGLAD